MTDKIKTRFEILTLIVAIIAVIVSVISMCLSYNSAEKTNNLQLVQNDIQNKLKVNGEKKIADLEKVTVAVSNIQTLANDISLHKDSYDRDDIEKLELLYNKTFELQSSFYPYLDKDNDYSIDLDKELTDIIKDTRKKAYNSLEKARITTLPKTASDPVSILNSKGMPESINLDDSLKKYSDKEQVILNEIIK